MQAGFALLEAGSVRAKNTKNILMKNLLDPCIGAVCWWTVGYGFAFGDTNKDDTSSRFIGRGQWFTSIDETNAGAANMWTTEGNMYTWWLFQWAFCATAGTIVSGSVAERMQFAGYITYTAVLTALVYPVVVHWAWSGNGWASKIQVGDDVIAVIDFAGSGVVHMVGGIAGLVGAYMLGPRIGWTKEKGIDGQNAVYTCLGTFLLWFGWYGFNCVSTGAIQGAGDTLGLVAVNTTLGGAMGALSALLITYMRTGEIDPAMAGNGLLGGLVSITAGCAAFEPYGAFLVGTLGGAVYVYSSLFVKMKLGIDDVCDAAAVHMFCGMWGIFSCGLFSADPVAGCGVFYAATEARACPPTQGSLLGAQLTFVVVVLLWTGAMSFLMFGALHKIGWLRVTAEKEEIGMDCTKHGGDAYEHQGLNRRMSRKFDLDMSSALPPLDQAELGEALEMTSANKALEFRVAFKQALADPELVEEIKKLMAPAPVVADADADGTAE